MTETVKAATDAEIAGYCGDIAIYQRGADRYLHCVQCDASPGNMGGHRPGCDFSVWPRIKARIDADRQKAEESAELIRELAHELGNARSYYIGDHRLGGREHTNQELVRWAALLKKAQAAARAEEQGKEGK